MEFQGFQSALSPYFIVLLALGLVLLSFVSYRKQSTIPFPAKTLLISLRSATLIIVLLLLANPFFFSSKSIEQKPGFLLMMDNSQSTTITKGEYNGVESYSGLLDELAISERSDIEADFFSFGLNSRQIQNTDSLNFGEGESNFIEAITQITELEDDYSAAILISDGIITFGRNPVIAASNLEIPIFTIGIGDTSQVKDVTINNIVTNATGYTDTRHIVEVEVAQNGFDNATSQVQILNSDNEVVASEIIEFGLSSQFAAPRFEIPLETEGLQAFRVEVTPLEGEWSNQNNSRNFSIDVLDSKTRILHITSEIHPDVKFIRTLLSSDPSMEFTPLTWLGGNRFVENDIPDFENLDLIILHGNSPALPIDELSALTEETPTVYLELPGTRRNFSNQSIYSLASNTGSQTFELGIYPTSDSDSHPILELDEINYSSLVPVLSSLRTEIVSPDAIRLLGITFQGIETPSPLLTISERGQLRRAHVSAWGWYRLFQSTSEEERRFVSDLFYNIISWASNNPDNRRLKIEPAKSSFSNSEQVIINASLVNESGVPETDGSIEIHIYSENDEEQVFNLTNLGGGNYSLTLQTLNTGLFSFSATARKGSRIIDEQQGEFIVEDSKTELINTRRNEQLLRALANETGGVYYPFDEAQSIWTDLGDRQLLNSNTISVDSYKFPVRSALWFVLVILLLGTEWVLRKNYSLP